MAQELPALRFSSDPDELTARAEKLETLANVVPEKERCDRLRREAAELRSQALAGRGRSREPA